MASVKGRARSYRLRHELKTFMMTTAHEPQRVHRQTVREQRVQIPWMPEATNDIERERQAFLLDVLLDSEVRKKMSPFGILWSPDCLWARGPSIEPFAHIFDRFVAGHWKVSISYNLGDGQTGWLFEPV